jgi:hypothetical protein
MQNRVENHGLSPSHVKFKKKFAMTQKRLIAKRKQEVERAWVTTWAKSRERACFRSGPTQCHSADLRANTVRPMCSSQYVSYTTALNLSVTRVLDKHQWQQKHGLSSFS